MSRTRHRTHETMKSEDRRRSSRPALTKGKHSREYSSSNFDYHEGAGGEGWVTWLKDYCGYGKQRKRRRARKIMKRYGRKVALRARELAERLAQYADYPEEP